MEIQEFPKALYRQGECTVVKDADEEAAAEGFTDWHTDQERMGGAADDKTETQEEPAELTAAQLKAELTERGIEFKGNASKAALQALLDEATQ